MHHYKYTESPRGELFLLLLQVANHISLLLTINSGIILKSRKQSRIVFGLFFAGNASCRGEHSFWLLCRQNRRSELCHCYLPRKWSQEIECASKLLHLSVKKTVHPALSMKVKQWNKVGIQGHRNDESSRVYANHETWSWVAWRSLWRGPHMSLHVLVLLGRWFFFSTRKMWE